MKGKLASTIGEFPARALEWPTWLIFFLAGLWLALPFYDPVSPNAILIGIPIGILLKVYGIIIGSIGACGLYGLIFNSYRWRQVAAFSGFFAFTYFMFIRIFERGFDNLGWTTFFLNACMAGAIYLRLKWEQR